MNAEDNNDPTNAEPQNRSKDEVLSESSSVEDHDPENSPVMMTRLHVKRRNILTKALETLGAHPLATGVLAVLGVVGFFVSIVGFNVDREEASQTTEQITKVDTNVTNVAQRLASPCRIQPCLNIQEVVRARTLGRPKDYLDARLPPAEDIINGQYTYLIEGCRVYIEYVNNVTTYVATDLFKIERDNDGKFTKTSCPFEVPRIIDPSSWELYDSSYNPEKYSQFPASNLYVTIGDMIGYHHGDIEIAQGCIECGNYSDPFLELFAFGSHAGDFVDLYFTVDYNNTSYENWNELKSALRTNFGSNLSEYDQLDANLFCDIDIWPAIQIAGAMQISRVGIGKGQRGWVGPEVFSCLD